MENKTLKNRVRKHPSWSLITLTIFIALAGISTVSAVDPSYICLLEHSMTGADCIAATSDCETHCNSLDLGDAARAEPSNCITSSPEDEICCLCDNPIQDLACRTEFGPGGICVSSSLNCATACSDEGLGSALDEGTTDCALDSLPGSSERCCKCGEATPPSYCVDLVGVGTECIDESTTCADFCADNDLGGVKDQDTAEDCDLDADGVQYCCLCDKSLSDRECIDSEGADFFCVPYGQCDESCAAQDPPKGIGRLTAENECRGPSIPSQCCKCGADLVTTTTTTTTIDIPCTDTDSGKRYNILGSVTDTCGSYEDYCDSSKILIEFFCTVDGVGFEPHTCDDKCIYGRCAIPTTTTLPTTSTTSTTTTIPDTGDCEADLGAGAACICEGCSCDEYCSDSGLGAELSTGTADCDTDTDGIQFCCQCDEGTTTTTTTSTTSTTSTTATPITTTTAEMPDDIGLSERDIACKLGKDLSDANDSNDGSDFYDPLEEIMDDGVATEDCVPSTGDVNLTRRCPTGDCDPSRSGDVYTIDDYGDLCPDPDPYDAYPGCARHPSMTDSMKLKLREGPIIVGVCWGLFSMDGRKLGMMTDTDDEVVPFGGCAGAHAITIVGYQDDPSMPEGGYFIFQNSWGSIWGDRGYGYFPYGKVYYMRALTVEGVHTM